MIKFKSNFQHIEHASGRIERQTISNAIDNVNNHYQELGQTTCGRIHLSVLGLRNSGISDLFGFYLSSVSNGLLRFPFGDGQKDVVFGNDVINGFQLKSCSMITKAQKKHFGKAYNKNMLDKKRVVDCNIASHNKKNIDDLLITGLYLDPTNGLPRLGYLSYVPAYLASDFGIMIEPQEGKNITNVCSSSKEGKMKIKEGIFAAEEWIWNLINLQTVRS